MWHRKRRTDDDFARELRAHLELEADALVESGLSRDAARDAARRRFGSVLRARERFRESRPLAWLDQVRLDLRSAWRGLARSPLFAIATVLTLGVALGLSTAVFTVFNAYVLRPFAVHDPHSLYEVRWWTGSSGGMTFSWRDFQEVRARADLFDGVLAERRRPLSTSGQHVAAAFVSGNYFEVLGTRILLGRPLAGFDARDPGGEPVAVLGHQAWTRLFNRDPAVVGRTLELNGRPVVVVGVLRPEFGGLDEYPRDVWLPLTMHGALVGDDLTAPGGPRELALTVRLRRGVTAERAMAGLTPLLAHLLDKDEPVRAELRPQATPAPLTWEVLAVLSPVFAAFVLVNLAACANVSSLMLARANARHREIGVRLSLGASRARIVRQLTTEGLLLAALSCLAALAIARLALTAAVSILLATMPPSIAGLIRMVPMGIDYRVLVFALAGAAGMAVLFALVPALQGTRLSLTHALRGEAWAGVGASRLRNLLVVSQVAVSTVLIVLAATLARNSLHVGATELGFDASVVLSVNQRIEGPSHAAAAAERFAHDARVAGVAVTSQNPLFGELPKVPARTAAGGRVVPTTYQFVSLEYFPVLDIPIRRGRGFLAAEAQAEALVGIINESGARALWGGADPIGRTLRMAFLTTAEGADEVTRLERRAGPDDPEAPGTVEVTIVGVAKDVVSTFVYVGPDPAHLYLPTSPTGPRASALLVRTRAPLRLDEAQALLRHAHANPQAFEVLPLEVMRALQLYPVQAASWIGTLLGALALGLSVSGLYGVLTFTLGQRIREIGIRMALGATAEAVVRLITGQAARLVGLGALVGLALSYGAMGLLSAVVRLQNVSMLTPGAFLAAAGFALAGAAAGSYLPARRATRVDPAITLRADG